MPIKPTIVVAGYGSWAKAENNPAAQIAKTLSKRSYSHCNLICMEVPVESDSLYHFLEQALLKHKPHAWLGLGVASRSPIICAELIGINWLHFDVPDINGAKYQLTPIINDGPVAYQSNLPNARLVEKLKSAHIPAALSFNAGTHLCNQMLYTVRHLVELSALNTLSGFIHVPHTPENIAKMNDTESMDSSMSLSLMTQAVELCVDEIATNLASPTPSAV